MGKWMDKRSPLTQLADICSLEHVERQVLQRSFNPIVVFI